MKKPLIDWPIKVAQPTTTIEMNVAIRAYSIDVAPERSSGSAVSSERIRSTVIASLEINLSTHPAAKTEDHRIV
jgi:hypothetical protein